MLKSKEIKKSNRKKIESKNIKKYIWLIIIILLAIIKLYLISVQPVNVLTESKYDDVLIIEQANSILNGKWLGEYNCLTLVKGVFAPLFLAFANILHIPFLLAQEIFYEISIIVLIIILRKIIKSKWKLLILYIILLFNPITYCSEIMRVYRDGLYTSLIIFLIAFTIGLFINRKEKIQKIIIYQIFLGFIISAIILCREETIWIIPYLMGTILVNTIYIKKEPEITKKIQKISSYIIPIIITLTSILIVMSINYKYYGVFELNQYWGKPFKEAYGALTRIVTSEEKERVPITREALKKAYEISPKFAELEEYLEGEEGKKWAECGNSKENEIQGGWIHWAIIRAAESKGYYANAQTANKYYEDVAEEINKACDEGKLESYPKRTSNRGRFKFDDIIKTISKTKDTIKYQKDFYLVIIRERMLPKIESMAEDIQNQETEEIENKFKKVTREEIISNDSYNNEDEKIKLKILEEIKNIYKTINPIIFIISIFATIIFIISRIISKKSKEKVWILLGLWGLYYSRIFIITYTYITMFQEAINISYLAPAYIIQLIVSVLSIIFLIDEIKEGIKWKKNLN